LPKSYTPCAELIVPRLLLVGLAQLAAYSRRDFLPAQAGGLSTTFNHDEDFVQDVHHVFTARTEN
jgi:hypothetical protein